MSAYKFKIAINPSLIDKHVGGDPRLFAHGWENVELSAQEIADCAREGIALCAQVKGGHRTKKRFLCSGAAFVDVDQGLTIEEARQTSLVQDHATFIYTTCSHTAEKQHFRIVFGLEHPITCAEKMQALNKALAARLWGDPAATDAARISFGATGSEVILLRNTLSDELVRELIQQGLHAPDSRSSAAYDVRGTARSALTLQEAQPLRLADGTAATIREAPVGAAVHCPVHDDRHASAFIVESKSGNRGVHCSRCAQTFWSGGTPPAYDFENFSKTIKRAAAFADAEMDGGPLGPFMDPPRKRSPITGSRVFIGKEQATPCVLAPGFTFIRSPKGSGKTEGLIGLTASFDRVVMISHRRGLIHNSAKRLRLKCYLDVSERQLNDPRIAVCLDSIHRLPGSRYDCVILDESESILRHLLSDTLASGRGPDRSYYYGSLRRVIESAKYVVASDADLGWVTFDTLTAMAPRHLASIWFNEDDSKTAGKPIDVYESDRHLIADMLRAIMGGGRYYVASNSKRRVHALSLAIKKESNGRCRQIVVTADTVAEEPVKRLLQNVQEEALKYQVILASPSVGTGVDITFPRGACEIDAVFGFFEADITTHFEVDQQLARVRNPGAMKVWISPKRSYFETDIAAVRLELMQKSAYEYLVDDESAEGLPTYRRGALTDMASLIHSEDRASRNALKANFIHHKQAQRYTVNFVEKDHQSSEKGATAFSEAKKARIEQRSRALLEAHELSRSGYEDIEARIHRGAVLNSQERIEFDRKAIELFYHCRVTASLIEQDDDGRFRGKVRLFEGLMDTRLARVVDRGPAMLEEAALLRSPSSKILLLHKLFAAAGIISVTEYERGGFMPTRVTEFDATIELSSGTLHEFVATLRSHRKEVETQLQLAARRDFEQKPVQELSRLLKMAGLNLAKPRVQRTGEDKIYWYRLDENSLQRMGDIAAKRAQAEREWKWPDETEEVDAA